SCRMGEPNGLRRQRSARRGPIDVPDQYFDLIGDEIVVDTAGVNVLLEVEIVDQAIAVDHVPLAEIVYDPAAILYKDGGVRGCVLLKPVCDAEAVYAAALLVLKHHPGQRDERRKPERPMGHDKRLTTQT